MHRRCAAGPTNQVPNGRVVRYSILVVKTTCYKSPRASCHGDVLAGLDDQEGKLQTEEALVVKNVAWLHTRRKS